MARNSPVNSALLASAGTCILLIAFRTYIGNDNLACLTSAQPLTPAAPAWRDAAGAAAPKGAINSTDDDPTHAAYTGDPSSSLGSRNYRQACRRGREVHRKRRCRVAQWHASDHAAAPCTPAGLRNWNISGAWYQTADGHFRWAFIRCADVQTCGTSDAMVPAFPSSPGPGRMMYERHRKNACLLMLRVEFQVTGSVGMQMGAGALHASAHDRDAGAAVPRRQAARVRRRLGDAVRSTCQTVH